MSLPIGVFDSGLGGLSVAAQIMRVCPHERIVYFADTAHVPYGERPLDEIRGYARDIVAFLVEEGAKAVVMACNMSSAVALEEAKNAWPDVPVIGMIEPGARAAVKIAQDAPIGILATTGTVKSEAYVREISRCGFSAQVVQQACPKFVPLVESGMAESEDAGCDTIILGCTHYPFLRRAIECAAGPDVTIVDPAEETALALANTLDVRGCAAAEACDRHEFYASGETSGLADLGSKFLGRPIGEVICRDLSAAATI